MDLGQQIAEVRKRKGLTQKELAEMSGISKDIISRLETGIHINPTLFIIRAISKSLDNVQFNIYK